MSIRTPFESRCEQTYHRRRFGLFALVVAAGGALWLLGKWRPVRVEIAGGSMAPGLVPGDWALATRARRLRRGDVVVIEHPTRPGLDLVKRVVAVPGDRAGPGRRLGSGELFAMGDRPEASTDSRAFGPVSESSVRGRVRLVYWPPARVGVLRRAPTEVANPRRRRDRPRRAD